MKGGAFKKVINQISHNQYILYGLFALTLLNLVNLNQY